MEISADYADFVLRLEKVCRLEAGKLKRNAVERSGNSN